MKPFPTDAMKPFREPPVQNALNIQRRAVLRSTLVPLAAMPVAVLLSACGFELRKAPELHFSTIVLMGFRPESPLFAILRQQIATTPNTRVVESMGQAQVVLQVFADSSERVVEASTAAGQVRELQLRSRLIFTVRTPDDAVLIPRTQLLLTRDLTYTEEAALGKEQEEAMLFRSMQADIVAQLVRRLAALRLP